MLVAVWSNKELEGLCEIEWMDHGCGAKVRANYVGASAAVRHYYGNYEVGK